jgi:hypothetical protein
MPISSALAMVGAAIAIVAKAARTYVSFFIGVSLSNWMFGALETAERAQRSVVTCWFL